MLLVKKAIARRDSAERNTSACRTSAERGIVFQRYSVFPHLTVLQNVMLASTLPMAAYSRVFSASPGAMHSRSRKNA